MREVVEAVGVSKPPLYHHFGSKLGLLEAVPNDGREALVTALRDAAADDHSDLIGRLNRALDAPLALAEERPEYYRLLSTLFVSPPEHETFAPANAVREELLGVFEALFVAAADDHGNMRGRGRRCAVTFFALIHGVVARRLAEEPPPDERERRDIIHQFGHGIYS